MFGQHAPVTGGATAIGSLIASLLSAASKFDVHPCSRAFCAHPQQLRGRVRSPAQRHCGKPAVRRILRLTRRCPRTTQTGRPTTGPSAGQPVYAGRQRGKERHDAFGLRRRRQTRKRTAAPVSERGRSRPALGGVPTGRSRAAAGCRRRWAVHATSAGRSPLSERGRCRPTLAGAAPGRRGVLRPAERSAGGAARRTSARRSALTWNVHRSIGSRRGGTLGCVCRSATVWHTSAKARNVTAVGAGRSGKAAWPMVRV